jgi:uncharacterized protein YbbK (DUF523 family)
LKILVSACILGQELRWDGKAKKDVDIREWAHKLGFEIVSVCPEHIMFGTPRRPIKLEDYDGEARAIMGQEDVTDKLKTASKRIRCRYKDVVGFIGVAKSPTCGHSVGVQNSNMLVKGAMHEEAPFPTTEINSMRTARGRMEFLDRIVHYITFNSGAINNKS